MSGGGATRATSQMKKTIQDIREIAGQHSDDDIYAMLQECSMDPDETAQRLLHLDTFHEVKKKNGRRKENVENRAFDNRGQQHSTRFGKGAKAGGGNVHFRDASQDNGRRFMGGSRENGYRSTSEGHHTENKSKHQISRSDHVKVDGSKILSSEKNIYGGAPQENEKILSNGNHPLSVSPGVLSSSSVSTPSRSDSVPGDYYEDSNGNANCYDDEMQNGGPSLHVHVGASTAKNQLTDTVGNGQGQQTMCVAKGAQSEFSEANINVEDRVSENDVSVVLEEAAMLSSSESDGQHVVFPEHLQVPEAYRKKLTFGSFDTVWTTDGESKIISNDSPIDVSCPASESNTTKSSTESGVIFSTVKDAKENEYPSHLQSPSLVSGSTPPSTGHAMPDVVIKIDEPETENVICDGGREPSKLANGVSFASQAHLKAQINVEPQDANFSASSTSITRPTNIIIPPGSSHDFVSTLPSAPMFMQSYHPNFFPYRLYYPQFIVPQVQQYMTHGGLLQPPLVANPYIASAVAAGIKYPHQQSKLGANDGTESYVGVPSGYSPYAPYAFPYGLPPIVIPGSSVGNDDHETQAKENNPAQTTEQQNGSLGEQMGRTDRTVPGMHVNPFYSYGLGLGHGHPMVSLPTPAACVAFGGVYQPLAHTVPASQPTLNSQIHQPSPWDQVKQQQV